MQRTTAIGLVASGSLLAGIVLLAALPVVVNVRGGGGVSSALGEVRAAAKAAIDAPLPTAAPAKPARAPLATPSWIWQAASGDGGSTTTLSRAIELASPARDARIVVAADNKASVLLDGRAVSTGDDESEWWLPREIAIGELAAGTHEIVIEARNEGGPAGVCAILEWTDASGTRQRVATDGSWTARAADGGAQPAEVVARLGEGPWGDGVSASFGTTVGDIERAIAVPAGFVCELVYAVPKARGSVVALAPAANGRIIASAQYGPLFAITPCADGGDPAATVVEAIEPAIGFAHGLLAVENDLFVVVSEGGPDARGLYRLRDTDGDGRYDEKKPLGAFARDGGEHGPHQVVLGPDGALWVVGGNHCAPPDEALAHSRVPRVWQEDVVFDRLWDPNGHAVGVMAPGGWIARTDREGAKWELMTIGFRNSYDLAFDEVGRAFTFDSDMEWDMGLPWYRPTRVYEAASGVDFGWRSGSGKWPDWSPDSLPPAVDVGPASPTGVLSSAGLQFPAPWNDCMFFLDWTYGTMWAGWPTEDSKDASTPSLRIEPFLAGRPLPLTDAITMDGAMYFAVGGRNLPSAIYRVRAENPVAIKRAAKEPPAALVKRRELEKHHRPMEWAAGPAAVALAFEGLQSEDAGVRSAARIALEHQDLAQWRDKALDGALAGKDPRAAVLALVALCRTGESARDASAVAERLAALEASVRGTPNERAWLRACELWSLRFGRAAADADRDRLKRAVLAHFPANTAIDAAHELDSHRAAWLSRAGAAEAVATTVALLERPDTRGAAKADTKVGAQIDAALLARGGPYGKAVADMLANAPSTRKIALVHAVRSAREGWTPDLRIRFARAAAELRRASGGNSFAGFLNRMTEEFVANAPEGERAFLASTAAGVREEMPFVAPRGPAQTWSVASIVALAPKLAAGRDHAEGVRAYRAAQCADCHRIGGIGASGGPELTAVSRRFSLEDLAASLVEPDRTVSDQYANSEVVLRDGRSRIGRIVADSDEAVEIRPTLLSDARERFPRGEIASIGPSTVSPMPAHLLDTLSEGELLDLLAFLRAGGDPGDGAFAPLDDDGYHEIFHFAHASAQGRSPLAAFDHDPRHWSIDNGEIVGRTTEANAAPQNTFLTWHGEVRDFELEVVMKVVGNNSGIQYRSELFDAHRLRGPQIDAHPAPAYTAMCYEEGGRGILAERGTELAIGADGSRRASPLAGATTEPAEIAEWHTYRVVAKGNTMRHFLDGKPTAVVVDDSPERAAGGKIGVQIHSGEPTEVRVRSIRLKRLDR
jgi:putative heme-binding domain-containing protein